MNKVTRCFLRRYRPSTYIRRSYQPRGISNILRYDRRRLLNRIRLDLDFRMHRIMSSGMPFNLTIEPTNICNLHCPLCFASVKEGQREKGFMSWETYVSVLDAFAPFLVKLQLYNAGEPFLHQGLFDMIDYAVKWGIKTQVSTNLTMCTEEHARGVIESGLDTLVVSIDGTSQETYGKYRVGGNFHEVMKNLKLLIQVKKEMHSKSPRILWSFLLFRHNLHELQKARTVARELGVDFLEQSAILGGAVLTDSRDPKLLDEWLPDERGIPRLFDYYSNQPFLNHSPCPWPWYSFVVLWDGTIGHCCHVNTPIKNVGCIVGADMRGIWNSSAFQSARNEFRKKKVAGKFGTTICSLCEIYRKPFRSGIPE